MFLALIVIYKLCNFTNLLMNIILLASLKGDIKDIQDE